MLTVASVTLLGVFIVCYAIAYVFGDWDEERTRFSNRGLLRLSSATLVVAALFFAFFVARDTELQTFARLIALGMFLSFLGDLVTGRLVPTPNPLVASMAVFGLAHVAYLVAIRAGRVALGAPAPWLGLALGITAGSLAWATCIRRKSEGWSKLNTLALGYAFLLGSMLGTALSLAWYRPQLAILAVGAILFTVSDTLIGNRELRKARWFMISDVVWFTYIVGQLLIIASVPTGVGVWSR